MSRSLHHSFDVNLAAEHGVESALLIHHFQWWIQINYKLGVNRRNGRTWTYQTLDEIAAHFPYLSARKVWRLCDKLAEKKVILKGHFSKDKMQQTVWYAFVDEQKFTTIPADKQHPIIEEALKEIDRQAADSQEDATSVQRVSKNGKSQTFFETSQVGETQQVEGLPKVENAFSKNGKSQTFFDETQPTEAQGVESQFRRFSKNGKCSIYKESKNIYIKSLEGEAGGSPPDPHLVRNQSTREVVGKKKPHGPDGLVMLTDEEYAKLGALMKPFELEELIEDLSNYLPNNPKKYQSHYYALRSWHSRRVKEGRGARRSDGAIVRKDGKVLGAGGTYYTPRSDGVNQPRSKNKVIFDESGVISESVK